MIVSTIGDEMGDWLSSAGIPILSETLVFLALIVLGFLFSFLAVTQLLRD